jgi:hypothetical protein
MVVEESGAKVQVDADFKTGVVKFHLQGEPQPRQELFKEIKKALFAEAGKLESEEEVVVPTTERDAVETQDMDGNQPPPSDFFMWGAMRNELVGRNFYAPQKNSLDNHLKGKRRWQSPKSKTDVRHAFDDLKTAYLATAKNAREENVPSQQQWNEILSQLQAKNRS